MVKVAQTGGRRAAVFVVALGLVIGFMAVRSQTANLATYPTAAFTFDDSTSNGSHVWALWSDDKGSYVYGKDGLGGTIDAEFTLSSGGFPSDVNLNLVKSKRKFNGRYAFDRCVFYGCAPLGISTGSGYSGSFSDGWFLTIWNIDTMANGGIRSTQAQFVYGGASTNPAQGPSYPRYQFTWCGGAPQNLAKNWVCTGRNGDGSGMVVAVRNDVTVNGVAVATWVITADDSANPVITGDAAASPGGDISEAIAQQSATGPLISRGLYHTPFRLAVQCVKGCSNLAYPPQ